MGVVGRIASGVSNDLVTRAADVCLKERRNLVLVIRETPLNLVHLRNLTALAEAGAVILPAAPAFYGKPQSIDDLVDFVVDRIVRVLGLDARLTKGWGE
jgi:4-hydroxy-3-polyprenylbenzoate decarboxylase